MDPSMVHVKSSVLEKPHVCLQRGIELRQFKLAILKISHVYFSLFGGRMKPIYMWF